MKVAVVGASGYVGSRLVPELLRRGHDVVATHHRSPSTAYPWSDDVEWRRVDVHDEDGRRRRRSAASTRSATSSTASTTPTSCGSTGRPPTTSRMPRASSARRVSSTSPASCPTCRADELSDHLLSRLEVEQILATAATSVLTLRASMVVGAGSTSFEVMRQTSQRLGVVQTVPAWMGSSVIQPVAVADAVYYLAEALERPEVTGHLDVVGPDQLTYLTLLRTYAARRPPAARAGAGVAGTGRGRRPGRGPPRRRAGARSWSRSSRASGTTWWPSATPPTCSASRAGDGSPSPRRSAGRS